MSFEGESHLSYKHVAGLNLILRRRHPKSRIVNSSWAFGRTRFDVNFSEHIDPISTHFRCSNLPLIERPVKSYFTRLCRLNFDIS